ncbi:gas vesicle protein [Streptomyces antimicrobicus]|uniref:Gas vesicle protein n=1 Tax=Streptomyces antimicrobicus TaxID=2883108 RepID=A0ABS8B3K8_9ACTN|nr:gas vesicle protein [Streptomyces antimicrobicus]MCB5179200.1 gas vesicle protein [Streptomyces antimicrobicus]
MSLAQPYGHAEPDRDPALPGRQVALVDLLDRLLAGGVVVTGDIVLSIADIDLVQISLRALISSVSTAGAPPPGDGHEP